MIGESRAKREKMVAMKETLLAKLEAVKAAKTEE